MESAPVISVVLVVYNAIAHIEDSVKHLLNQQFSNYEIIVVDGGSDDGTAEVLTKYKDRLGALHIKPDNGIYDAMNKGIRLSRGEFLYFIGVDDRLLIDLSVVAPRLKSANTIYYGDVWLKQDKRSYAGPFNTARIIRANICHQAIFYPRGVFANYQYDTGYKTLADYMLNITLWGDKAYRFEYIPLTIAEYNQEGASSVYWERKFSFQVLKVIYQRLGMRYLLLKIFNPLLNLLQK